MAETILALVAGLPAASKLLFAAAAGLSALTLTGPVRRWALKSSAVARGLLIFQEAERRGFLTHEELNRATSQCVNGPRALVYWLDLVAERALANELEDR